MLQDEKNIGDLSKIYKAELTQSDFNRLGKFIINEFGIKMPPEKKTMLQSRLQKRLRALKMNNFKDYLKYLFSNDGMTNEVIHMIDVVSTNKTDFFRESAHFDYMKTEALPTIIGKNKMRNIKMWSAGCSSGEEPYTMAITTSEFLSNNTGVTYSILATDISTSVLKTAYNAIYNEERINEIPLHIKRKYFLRSKNREEMKVKLINDIRNKVTFKRQNFLELNNLASPEYHIIFCRNALIYFDRPTQLKILKSLCNSLYKGGYLFLGHSESITDLDLPIKNTIPSTYIKI